jgi:predicted transport protein
MSDIKLFRINTGHAEELTGTTDTIEKSLQVLFEKNLDSLLGVRFLATEFTTTNGGRIDTLGLDENGCPVIIEYKRAANENVINQGLFYLDWLMDHRKDFQWLVLDKLGKPTADTVDWSTTAAAKTSVTGQSGLHTETPSVQSGKYKTISAVLAELETDMLDRFEALRASLLALGDDVQERTLKNYIAFTRIKNFACVEFRTNTSKILLYLKVSPKTVTLEPGFTRDVSTTGHYGTGDLEVSLSKPDDLDRALPLIAQSYANS